MAAAGDAAAMRSMSALAVGALRVHACDDESAFGQMDVPGDARWR